MPRGTSAYVYQLGTDDILCLVDLIQRSPGHDYTAGLASSFEVGTRSGHLFKGLAALGRRLMGLKGVFSNSVVMFSEMML